MGFDAASAVESLDWDFTAFNAGKGTSPEPSTREIEQFFKKSHSLAEAIIRSGKNRTEDDSEFPEDLTFEQAWDLIAKRLDAPRGEDAESLARKMSELVAETTHNCPSADQLMKLPHRVRSSFFGWFTGQMLDPESAAAGT